MSSDPKLSALRARIDRLDMELLNTLGERMKVVEEIGKYKQNQDPPIDAEDPERERKVHQNWLKWAGNRGLSAEPVRKIIDIILDYAKKTER
jgi:chorismate mutase